MNLQQLGYLPKWDTYKADNGLENFEVARVTSEHKDRYTVKNIQGDYEAELIGSLRFTANYRSDLPAVGDWVAISPYDAGKALIHAVYPRSSCMERRAVGKTGQAQIIAANIDYALLVQAVDRDFNLNRLERYVAICKTSQVVPVGVLSKSDLVSASALNGILAKVKSRLPGMEVLTMNNKSAGFNGIADFIQAGKTYCLLGSSGVGKSTLLNCLLGEEIMETRELSISVNKGKHTTTHRELFILPQGGIIIDNPGMREVGMANTRQGIEETFEAIVKHAQHCRFADCTHTHEAGCAVLEALESGELDEAVYQNYLKMEKEQAHFEADTLERRLKDKDFGKMVKQVKRLKKGMKG